MGTAARLGKDGTFLLNDSLNERLPVVTDGLIVHYPLDSKGGGFDVIGGTGTVQNLEQNVNLVEAMANDWRDPNSWSSHAGFEWNEGYQAMKITGYYNSWLLTPIVVDTTKEYQVSMEIMEEVSGAAGLYLGGVDFNKDGVRVTQNYDYTLAANTTPPLGQWITYRITRTGTGAMVDQTSTSFDNSCGWTGNGTPTDKLTKYYHLGGLFNYNGGGVMYIRNLSIVSIDADTSNTIETNEGMSVETSTTNVIGGDFDTSFESLDIGSTAGFSNQLGTGNELGVVNFGYNEKQSLRALRGDGNRFYRTKSIALGNAFTVSAWVYSTQSGTIIRFEYNGGDYSWSVPYTNNTHTGSGWEFLWCSGPSSATSATTAYYFFYPGQSSTPIFVDNIQAELTTFATSWVSGSKSQGKIFLPIEQYLNNTEGTIHFKHKMEYGISNTIISGSIVQNTPPNAKWWGLYRSSNGTTYIHWLDGTTHTSAFQQNQYTWVDYTIKWDASNERYYASGVQIGSKARSAFDPTDQFPTITLGWGWTAGEGLFKDFSIYNKALDDNQIKKLVNQSTQIKENETITNLLVEEPILPWGAFYYQLSDDTLDITHTLDGSDTTNLGYEHNAVWVGTATNNNYTTPDFESVAASANWNHWGSTGNIGTYGVNTDKDFIRTGNYSHWVANGAGATADYLLYQACVYDGGWRSQQVIVKMSDGSPVTNDKVSASHNNHNGGLASGTWSSIKHIGGGWYHCKAEGFSQDGDNDLVFFRVLPGYKAYFDFAQLEDYKPFSSPMQVYGTRAISSLEFNFYDSIGLDWSGDWSISYWKRPQSTANDLQTSYSIESLGSNSNSVGGGYTWYGKSNGADTLSSSTPSAIIPANYFNHWHWISMVKTGTNIVTTTRGIEGNLLSVRNTTTTNSVANYYVNQYGYDFKFGWDNTNVTNAYFRDLVVVKRALSSTEEEELYMGMRMYRDRMITKNLTEQGI